MRRFIFWKLFCFLLLAVVLWGILDNYCYKQSYTLQSLLQSIGGWILFRISLTWSHSHWRNTPLVEGTVLQEGVVWSIWMFCPRLGATWKQLSRWWMAISTMGSPPSLLVWVFKWPEEWTGKRAQLQKVEGRQLGSFMEENKTLNLRAEVWKNPGADET